MVSKNIRTVGVAVQKGIKDAKLLHHLLECLRGSGKKIFLFPHVRPLLTAKSDLEIAEYRHEKIDLLIVLGGDGTILRTIQRLASLDTYVLGINAGHLGFLSEIPPDNLQNTCLRIWDADFTIDERMLLAIERVQANGRKTSFRALNEAVISQSAVARLVELPTMVDRDLVATFRADGLIIATPTGSTAYNLSAGGPILYPRLEAIILTPIVPFSLTQKPLVIPAEKTVTVEIGKQNKEPMVITIDGQINEELASGDLITISRHPEKVKFLRFPEENYFKTLREKLKWGERL